MTVYDNDFSSFGYREIKEMTVLLNAWMESNIDISPLKVGFNDESGYVFLFDDDYGTYMMNGESLEEWINCGYCGNEGFLEDIIKKDTESVCSECGRDLFTGEFPEDKESDEE
jgi:hypothetical protein